MSLTKMSLKTLKVLQRKQTRVRRLDRLDDGTRRVAVRQRRLGGLVKSVLHRIRRSERSKVGLFRIRNDSS